MINLQAQQAFCGWDACGLIFSSVQPLGKRVKLMRYTNSWWRRIERTPPPTAPPLTKATVYTQVELPPLIPPWKGGKQESSSLPFARGGLGWGKTRIYQLFPTSVYMGALPRGGWEGSK